MVDLITEHMDIWTGAQEAKTNGGRGRRKKSNAQTLYGIKKLRELILELAIRGKLVPQDPNDEPAGVLLDKIAKEKARLIKKGKIKKQNKLPEISENEKPFDLPNGWRFVRLGDITNRIGSGSTPRGGKSVYVSSGIPFLRSQNVWNYGLDMKDIAHIPEEIHQKMSNTIVLERDILLNITGGSLGRCTIFPDGMGEANVSQHVTIIRPTEMETRFYLHLCLLSPYTQALIWGRQVGMAWEGLSKKVLELFEIPTPPLGEQHRIVAKVDELMALCDQLEQQQTDNNATHQTLVETLLTTLTNAPDQGEVVKAWQRIANHIDTLFATEQSIDQLKQTILQLAVMGKLVPQDSNDEPASVLLDNIAKEKVRLIKDGKIKKQKKLPEISEDEKAFELPAGWAWSRMTSLMDANRGISYGIIKLGKEPKEGGIPTLRCSDVKNRYIDINFVRTVSPEIEKQYKRTRLKGGEVLINVRGTLGGVALVPSELDGYNIAREVAILPIYK